MWRVLKYGGVPTLLTLAALGAACGEESQLTPGGQTSSGAGGAGTAGAFSFGGTASGGFVANSPCAGVVPPAPLTRLSIADIDGTLDASFGPGTTLASVVAIDDQGFQRDLSSAFVGALRTVATERVKAVVADTDSFEICEGAQGEPTCLEPWLRDQGQRLYRRPLTAEQVAAYVAQFRSANDQRTPAEAARNVLVSMTLSAYFVFRIELGERLDGQQLTAYEIAARLSHFATRQAPDAELLSAAAAGALKAPADLVAQLHRLWETPQGHRARTLRVLEWLGVSEKTLPETLDPDLRTAMLAQSSAFVDDVFESNSGSLTSLLTSPRQPLNARLALHYGAAALSGDELQFVNLDPTNSAGVLSEGPFLSSYPRPTLRGRAIIERLMCRRVPDHPAQVDASLGDEATPRQRIEQRTLGNPACLGCHAMIDATGFALDGFDDEGRATGFNTTTTLPIDLFGDAAAVMSPRELGTLIANSSSARACAAQRYLEALLDRPIAETITAKVVLPPGNAGAPLNPAPYNNDPDHQWLDCLLQNAGAGDFSMTSAAELLVSGSAIQRRAGTPHQFAAFDTSLDPVEHAYQEAAQFRDAFQDSSDNQTILRYMDALRMLQRLDALGPVTSSDGGAGGDTFGGASGIGGAP